MPTQKITKEMNIMEVLDKNPDAAEILMDAGLSCIGCAMAHAETLEQGLQAHGFKQKEINEVIKKLNK